MLVGRRVGHERLDILGAVLRIEAKPGKYTTGGIVRPWETGLLAKFSVDDFDSVILHRFLYKPVKEYIEDPVTILRDVKGILRQEGRLIVNSYLLDDVTKSYQSADSFFTEEEMQSLLGKQSFRKMSRVVVGGSSIFVCEM